VGGTRIAHGKYEKCLQSFVGNLKRNNFKDPRMDGMIICGMFFSNQEL
jgi:hypothetical protein